MLSCLSLISPLFSPYLPPSAVSSQHLYSSYPSIRCSHDVSWGVGPGSSTESLYSSYSSVTGPSMKLEYPGSMCGVPSSIYSSSLPARMPSTGIYPSGQQRTIPSNNIKQVSLLINIMRPFWSFDLPSPCPEYKGDLLFFTAFLGLLKKKREKRILVFPLLPLWL